MLKEIEIKGSVSASGARPRSISIADRTLRCLRHMLVNSDARYGFVPFVGATLGEERPHLVHHRLDWTEVMPYSIYGMVVARDITGSDEGVETQQAQRRLYLSFFNEMDGLIHSPKSPWNDSYPMDLWEQTRALYALIYWFQESEDERLLDYITRIVDGVFPLSRQDGALRVFPNEIIRRIGMGVYGVGSLIDPLVKVYEMTANTKALQLAEGLTNYMLDSRTGFFDEEGKFSTFFRTVASVINGLSRFASLAARPDLVERVKRIHDHAVSLCTTYGSTPCTEPACSNMELSMSAYSLTRLGFEEYWDQIDRFARNQTAEAQFLDPKEWEKGKAHKGRILDKEQWVYDHWPPELETLPFDDYANVVEKCIGGFMWTSADEHLFIPASVMLCCAAHALRTFHLIWKNSLVENIGGIAVNLHYNCENHLGEVISFEPFVGKTTVVLKKDANLRVRIPEHAAGGKVTGAVDGGIATIKVVGRYADFGPVKSGSEVSLEFPLNERTTEEKQYSFMDKDCARLDAIVPLRAKWRGNTVVALDPESRQEKRIYKRRHLDTEKYGTEEASYFVSDRDIYW